MRRRGAVDRPVGCGPHDHLCWVYDAPADWLDVAIAYLQEGVERAEQLVYVAEKGDDGLRADLRGLPGRDAMLECGRLKVMSLADAYGPKDGFDAARPLRTYRELALAAVDAGYAGLRLATDLSGMVATEPTAAAFTAYELLADELIDECPIVSLCGYDARRAHHSAPSMISFVHPLRHVPGVEARDGLSAEQDGWRLSGELDLGNARTLDLALSAIPATHDVHLHLDEVTFCDAAAMRSLVRLAERLQPARRLVLHDPPPLISWVLHAGWPEKVPGLEVVSA